MGKRCLPPTMNPMVEEPTPVSGPLTSTHIYPPKHMHKQKLKSNFARPHYLIFTVNNDVFSLLYPYLTRIKVRPG